MGRLTAPSLQRPRARDWIIADELHGHNGALLDRLEAMNERYVSNADAHVPLGTLAQVTGVRWRVEELFAECKGHLGMRHYEARAWASWHHHMALVAVAHLFLTLTRLRLKRKRPHSKTWWLHHPKAKPKVPLWN